MNRIVLFSAVCGVLLSACAAPTPPAPEQEELSPDGAARAIRESERFREPLWLEIWAHQRGPSARELESRGLLRFDEEREQLRLTEGAIEAGAWERGFDRGVALFYFPVARRDLIEVRGVEPLHGRSGLRRVEFTYRRVPTSLGDIQAGPARTARKGDTGEAVVGTAVLDRVDDRWRVALLNL